MIKIKILLIFSVLLTIGCDNKKEINIQDIKGKLDEQGYSFDNGEGVGSSYYLDIYLDSESENDTIYRASGFEIDYYIEDTEDGKIVKEFKITYVNYYSKVQDAVNESEVTRVYYDFDTFDEANYIRYAIKDKNDEQERNCMYFTDEEYENDNNKEVCNEESGISNKEIKDQLKETEKNMDIELDEIGVTREEFKEWLLAYINSSIDGE